MLFRVSTVSTTFASDRAYLAEKPTSCSTRFLFSGTSVHFSMGSRPGIEAQGCPSACSTGRMCFRNPATRASSGRAPGVKDPGRGRLQRTGTLGAGQGGNPDSHSPLPLTSVNCHSYSFLHFSPQKFCFRSSFPRGNVEGKSLSFDPFWTQLST